MQRDIRRGQGQWRGCYSFQNIVREDSARPDRKRAGGLKMGHTYYYYYEVNGSTETFDPSMPWTTSCPSMPGQTVNTLCVPMERSLRYRSASMGSMRQEDFRTMNPEAKFDNPKPLPPLPREAVTRRTGSASILRHCASSRSLSPAPSWKRLFQRRMHGCEAPRGRSLDTTPLKRPSLFSRDTRAATPPVQESDYTWLSTSNLSSIWGSSEGAQSRDMSPDSQTHRLLRDEFPSRPASSATQRPTIDVGFGNNHNDFIAADEIDDDDNFASSAVSESQSYFTSLSPPPFQRSSSSESIALAGPRSPAVDTTPPKSAQLDPMSQPRWSISVASATVASPMLEEEEEEEEEHAVLLDSHDEDDNEDLDNDNDNDNDNEDPFTNMKHACSPRQDSFPGYSLPELAEQSKTVASPSPGFAGFKSSSMIPRGPSGVPVNGTNMLGGHVDTGLDDFAADLGWMMDVIGNLRS